MRVRVKIHKVSAIRHRAASVWFRRRRGYFKIPGGLLDLLDCRESQNTYVTRLRKLPRASYTDSEFQNHTVKCQKSLKGIELISLTSVGIKK